MKLFLVFGGFPTPERVSRLTLMSILEKKDNFDVLLDDNYNIQILYIQKSKIDNALKEILKSGLIHTQLIENMIGCFTNTEEQEKKIRDIILCY